MKLQRHLTDKFLFGLFFTTFFLALPLICSAQAKVVFSTERDGVNNSEIYVMNPDGTNPTNLTNNPGYDAGPSFSPNGNKIAFHSYRDSGYQIYLMNADGTNQTRL